MGCMLKDSGLHSRLAVGAVLLAAGEARRMGGRPKALLQLGGVPLIRRNLIALSGAGVGEVAVVLGHRADEVEPALRAQARRRTFRGGIGQLGDERAIRLRAAHRNIGAG